MSEISERSATEFSRANKVFLYWLGALCYAAFCLWGGLLPPLLAEDGGMGLYALAFLNHRGAWIVLLVSIPGTIEAYLKRRAVKQRHFELAMAEVKDRTKTMAKGDG
jgi:hypothetical protein